MLSISIGVWGAMKLTALLHFGPSTICLAILIVALRLTLFQPQHYVLLSTDDQKDRTSSRSFIIVALILLWLTSSIGWMTVLDERLQKTIIALPIGGGCTVAILMFCMHRIYYRTPG